MLSTTELTDQAVSLPVEERAKLIDSLLKSLNPTSDEADQEWIKIAKIRLDDIHSGKVKVVPGHEVFEKVKARFNK
jgi:putative addiction module component (TIGR02574 family)